MVQHHSLVRSYGDEEQNPKAEATMAVAALGHPHLKRRPSSRSVDAKASSLARRIFRRFKRNCRCIVEDFGSATSVWSRSQIPSGSHLYLFEDLRAGIEMSDLEVRKMEMGIEALCFNDRMVEDGEHAFLSDSGTEEWIRGNRVMFVMRGLPGSGKSTLAKTIVSKYENAVVCSADHYFISDRGGGDACHFSKERIQAAHNSCLRKMREAVESEALNAKIVIDNRNVERWEMEPYFKQAQTSKMYVIIVEPKTSWRLDPKVLAEKNQHGVSRKMLERKARDYVPYIVPLYVGWFLDASDSADLLELGDKLLASFGLSNRYSREMCLSGHGLHCTASYLGRTRHLSMHDAYLKTASRSMGRTQALTVTKFVITRQTFAAAVKLGPVQLELLDVNKDVRSAHITLGTADGIPPETAGFDVCQSFRGARARNVKPIADDFELEGTMKRFDRGSFHVFKLRRPLQFPALFTGHY